MGKVGWLQCFATCTEFVVRGELVHCCVSALSVLDVCLGLCMDDIFCAILQSTFSTLAVTSTKLLKAHIRISC